VDWPHTWASHKHFSVEESSSSPFILSPQRYRRKRRSPTALFSGRGEAPKSPASGTTTTPPPPSVDDRRNRLNVLPSVLPLRFFNNVEHLTPTHQESIDEVSVVSGRSLPFDSYICSTITLMPTLSPSCPLIVIVCLYHAPLHLISQMGMNWWI